jgi:hypothetical protein
MYLVRPAASQRLVDDITEIFIDFIDVNSQVLLSPHSEMTTFINACLIWTIDILDPDIDILYAAVIVLHLIAQFTNQLFYPL